MGSVQGGSPDKDELSEEVDATLHRPLVRPPVIGDVVAGKYRLTGTLGRGGMGRIFAAEHLLLGTRVALKFMHPHLAKDRVQVKRFTREARAAAALKSEHVARIIDVDHLPTGELYIVMEYLEGTSLETIIVETNRGLPVAEAVTHLRQACDAIIEAHACSILHRDLKPANLFLTRGKNGEAIIKVLDFGLAKSVGSSDGFSIVSVGSSAALGTPHYMSPEQITGDVPVDGRTDVWALGATLYELVTGRLAFPGKTAPVVFDRVLRGDPPSVRNLRADVPDAIVRIIERCLTRDVTKRYATVRDLSRALELSLLATTAPLPPRGPITTPPPKSTGRFVHSSAPPPAPVVSSPPPSVPAESIRAATLSTPDQSPGRRGTMLAALAGPLLVAVAAGVIAVVMGSDRGGGANAGVTNAPVIIEAKSASRPRAKLPTPPASASADPRAHNK